MPTPALGVLAGALPGFSSGLWWPLCLGLWLMGRLNGLNSSCWAWKEIQYTGGGLLHDTGPTHQHQLGSSCCTTSCGYWLSKCLWFTSLLDVWLLSCLGSSMNREGCIKRHNTDHHTFTEHHITTICTTILHTSHQSLPACPFVLHCW